MKEYNLKSGTNVSISDKLLIIERTSGKSAVKSLFAGRTMGNMVVKISSITGLILNADYLIICASGLPAPSDFKISSVAEIKQYPNCIVAKQEELTEIYDYLQDMLS